MMKQIFVTAIFATALLVTTAHAQTYQSLSSAEQAAYVKAKAERLGAAMANHAVEFSPAYLALVTARADAYAKRVGVKTQGIPGKEDLGLVLTRGASQAASFAKIFQAHNLSPLIGIYLPMMESEFRNELVSDAGSAGMFQFMPQTAVRFGLTAEERTDPAKSADAAARYLGDLQSKFAGNIWLSLLSYNIGERGVEKLLMLVPEARGAACSICSFLDKKETLGKSFPKEGENYTPALLAAAIVGEHPKDFGLAGTPLSAAVNNK